MGWPKNATEPIVVEKPKVTLRWGHRYRIVLDVICDKDGTLEIGGTAELALGSSLTVETETASYTPIVR